MDSHRRTYLLATAAALVTAFFLYFGIGALGIIGAGGPADLMYVAALAAGLLVALATRFRARGMALAMTVTALATLAVGVVAVAAGLHREEGASVAEILGLSAMYAALWGLSGWLYRRAATPT